MATDDDTGSVFPVPDESELPERIQGLFGKAREAARLRAQRVPRLVLPPGAPQRVVRPLPAAARTDEGLAGRGPRDGGRRRRSQANGCLYCLVAHGQALREALGDPIQGDRITLDWRRAGLDESGVALSARSPRS